MNVHEPNFDGTTSSHYCGCFTKWCYTSSNLLRKFALHGRWNALPTLSCNLFNFRPIIGDGHVWQSPKGPCAHHVMLCPALRCHAPRCSVGDVLYS